MVIGIIAEETNDVDVLYHLTCKLIKESSFSFKRFVGHGCGKLRKKCSAWARNLLARGCSHLIVVHDLDDADLTILHLELEAAISHVAFGASLILIPVREMEAWLLADANAVATAFNLKKTPKCPSNPEEVLDPKKKLGEIVWASGKKQYVNTIHNAKIAKEMSIPELNKCKSFLPFPKFVMENLIS
jgi:hypothetical protein